MIAISLFLQSGQPGNSRFQLHDFRSSLQQVISQKSPRLAVCLATSLQVLLLSCHEVQRFNVVPLADLISPLVAQTYKEDVAAAVFLNWVGGLEAELKRRRSAFSFVLAALRFKKLELYKYALWSILQAWRRPAADSWPHLHVSLKVEN